jgi:endonuclease IV
MITFNASVVDKNNLAKLSEFPFQIMPSQTKIFSEKTLEDFSKANINNPNILIHMNYICKIFSPKAIPENSLARLIIKQYKILADSINSKNILFHLPATLTERDNINIGFSIIEEELKNYKIYLEIPTWTSALRKVVNKMSYLDEIDKFLDESHQQYVFDTAHLYANGYSTSEMIELFKKYKCDFCHLNGNKNLPNHPDVHTTIFSSKNKWQDYDELCKILAKTDIICIAEMTGKKGNKSVSNDKVNDKVNDDLINEYEHWQNFSNQYKFKIVPFNKAYSL